MFNKPTRLNLLVPSLLKMVIVLGLIWSASGTEDVTPTGSTVRGTTRTVLSPAPPAVRRPCNMFARKSCICPMNFKPLCGQDGITYANLCQFQCAQRCEPDLNFGRCGTCWQNLSASRACLTA